MSLVHAVTLEATSTKYLRTTATWASQVAQLHGELRSAGLLEVAHRADPGMKGAAAEIILALGDARAIGAAVIVIASWLGRDRTRKVVVRRHDSDETLELSADSITDKALTEFIKEVRRGQ